MPLDYRGAMKLMRKHRCKFVRHGSKHDIFETAEGVEIQVPRHPGDFSSGVEKDIKAKLGLK